MASILVICNIYVIDMGSFGDTFVPKTAILLSQMSLYSRYPECSSCDPFMAFSCHWIVG